ncbi:hypothetical protein U1Q18_021213 [Sarracenia purpurea var. burkii]
MVPSSTISSDSLDATVEDEEEAATTRGNVNATRRRSIVNIKRGLLREALQTHVASYPIIWISKTHDLGRYNGERRSTAEKPLSRLSVRRRALLSSRCRSALMPPWSYGARSLETP